MKGKDASRGKLKTEAWKRALIGSMSTISEHATQEPTTKRHGSCAVSDDEDGSFQAWGLKAAACENTAILMKKLSSTPLLLLSFSLFLSSCSGTTAPPAPGPSVVKAKPPAVGSLTSPAPRHCTTPDQVCPYGTGPAGEPCSCWSTDGSPDTGITTIGSPASATRGSYNG